MKLSLATNEQKIKALAELDGWNNIIMSGEFNNKWWGGKPVGRHPIEVSLWAIPPYLTSYDAIIPLIQKQSEWLKVSVMEHLRAFQHVVCWLDASPTQLSDSLLTATGKFEL